MTTHNHPPRCCCPWNPDNPIRKMVCSLCPEHGELAQLAEPECPSCHTQGEHPHTDYCQLVDHASQLTHAELGSSLAAQVTMARCPKAAEHHLMALCGGCGYPDQVPEPTFECGCPTSNIQSHGCMAPDLHRPDDPADEDAELERPELRGGPVQPG